MSENFDLIPSENKIINFDPTIPKIVSIKDLINQVSTYFDLINSNKSSPTYNGLALFLGITRHKLKFFPKDHPAYPIIERAKQYISDYAEQQLFSPKPASGVAFWLKNSGDDWQDKSEISITQNKTMKEIIDEIDIKNSSPIIYDAELSQSTESTA